MQTVLIIAVIVIIIGAIISLSIWSKRKADKRRQAMADWAKSKGLSFRPGNDSGIGNRFRLFKCLQQGENRYGYNIMEGPIGNRKVCAFDYHYETHTKTHTQTHMQTHTQTHIYNRGDSTTQTQHYYLSVVIVETDLPLKTLFIRTEGFLDKVTEFIGFNDIDFESTEFSKQFYVKSPDKKWAYDVLDQKNMELLLSSCHFDIEFNGNHVIAYRNELFSAGYFEEALLLLTRILDNLPESLIQELKGVK